MDHQSPLYFRRFDPFLLLIIPFWLKRFHGKKNFMFFKHVKENVKHMMSDKSKSARYIGSRIFIEFLF